MRNGKFQNFVEGVYSALEKSSILPLLYNYINDGIKILENIPWRLLFSSSVVTITESKSLSWYQYVLSQFITCCLADFNIGSKKRFPGLKKCKVGNS